MVEKSHTTPVPTRRPVPRALRAATEHVQALETRRLLAAIEGNIYLDTDNDALRDFFENGLADVVVYIDENLNNQRDAGEPFKLTDSKGNYEFTDLAVDETNEDGTTYYLGHEIVIDGIEGRLAQTLPGVTGSTNVESAFDIELVYATDNLSNDQKTLIETAAAKWESVIIGDVPDIAGIDDLEITVTGAAVDGPGGALAFARPTAFRPGSSLQDFAGNPVGLPFKGEFTIDIADGQPSRAFVETVTHEIGHILGIGSLWDGFLLNRGTSGVAYNGDNGTQEYGRLFDISPTPAPVEPFVEGHWDEDTFSFELMSPFANGGFELPPDADPVEALSRMTVGALEDLGWEVNYGGSEFFGPFNIGPLPEDLIPELGFRPFQIGVNFLLQDDVVDDANFGVRFNDSPNPFFFNAGPTIVQPGQDVRLLAELDRIEDMPFDGDVDFRDTVIQINMYRETNGEPGLQTSVDVDLGRATTSDELLVQDANSSDGFDLTFDTTGLPLGEQTFYARAFDEGYFTTDRVLTVQIVGPQTLPGKPSNLQAVPTATDTILLDFIDNSDDESGFIVEASSSVGFDVTADIERFFLPASDGTGPVEFTYTTDEGPNTTRYFRVRAFNTAGATPFAGRALARTLSVGEVLVDNSDDDAVTNDGFTEVVDPARSVGLSYLRGTGGSVDFNPLLGELHEYFVFLKNVDIGQAGSVVVQVFSDANGVETLLDEVEVDQDAAAGGNVLVGTYQLGEGSFVRVAHNSGVATADAVRFLRTGSDA